MSPSDTYAALAEAVAAFPPPDPAVLSDAALVEAQRSLARLRRQVDALSAGVAAQIAHRSRRELGYDGLAQRHGTRTPEALVQRVTGASRGEARTLVRVGTLIAETTGDAATAPWMHEVARACAKGLLSLEAADAIHTGLGTPDQTATTDALTLAASALLRAAPGLTPERLAARARQLRDELDDTGVAVRENALRERRHLRLVPQPDGMTRLTGLLDPESAAAITAAVDAVTTPRRGGPRFVDSTSRAREERVLHDGRSTEQLMLDTVIELIRLGAAADDGSLLGAHRPAVRIHVAERDVSRRTGVAHIEGQTVGVSIATADRQICENGIVAILFDDDTQVVNVGRDQRLFTAKQRIGLAARDGGCRFPGCDRPPAWTEAHHINQWHRDHGRTDIADGVLLCRHHHLLVHNNGWRIVRRGAEYFAVPPRDLDPEQRPIPAPPSNLLIRKAIA